MGQTLSEQILSHAAMKPVQPGDLIVISPDVVMSHDSLTPSIIQIMQEDLGKEFVHNPEQLVIVMDHVVPPSTVGTANNQNIARKFAEKQGIRFFDVGRGICHQVLVEEKIATPGKIILGADSHSTSYGSVGAFGSGMGSTDIALIWATGQTWLRVPESIRVLVQGRFSPWVGAKDLALKLCRDLTIAGATYAAVEYHGLDWMELNQRQTLTGMAVEMGAKAGIVPPTGLPTNEFCPPDWLYVDPKAQYAQEVSIDLKSLEPQVSIPHSVDNVADISALSGQRVNVVFLGTCTNGRYEDMKIAADILNGNKIANNVRFIVTPASNRELKRAAEEGVLSTLIEAGATLTTPGCGACMGRHQGTLGDQDVCLSTGNRNFKGRMGSPLAQVYLASPEVAAATAITGQITHPQDL
jgi:methanogen homoaconitase large subunit